MKPHKPPILRHILRDDLGAFTHKCVDELLSPGTFQANWHIELLTDYLTMVESGSVNRLIFNLPPRHLKSVITTIAFVAWVVGRDPSKTIMCVSYAQSLSTKHARDFQRIVESNWYRELFPKFIISKNTEDTIETTLGGGRIAASFGGPVTGLGADLMIIDDPMKPEDATDVGRERAIRIYRETLFSRLNNKATDPIILVMQRLHEDDLAGYLIARGGWASLVLPAIATRDETFELKGGRSYNRKLGEPLHAAREPLSALREVRENLGTYAFEAQYQQNPVPADGNVLKREWLQRYKLEPDRSTMEIVQSWDTAQKNDPKSDYTVCTTWGRLNNRHYLLDVYRERVDFPELLKAVVRLVSRDNPRTVLIEDHGSGISLIQQLKIHGIFAIGQKAQDSKEMRFNSVMPVFERKELLLPNDAPWLMALEHELLGFPNTKHDDQVDSVSQYLNYVLTKPIGIFEYDFRFYDGPPTHDDIAADLIWTNFLRKRN